MSNTGNFNDDSQNSYVKNSRNSAGESSQRPQYSNRRSRPSSDSSFLKHQQVSNASYGRNTRGYVSAKTSAADYVNVSKKPASEKTPEMIKAEKRKAAQKQMLKNNFKQIFIVLVIVISVSVLISTVAISCVNDILAIKISEKDKQSVSVEIVEGMDTADVIDALDDAGVIKNAIFCKLAAKFLGYKDEGYIPRTYELNRTMGLENMLNEIKNNSSATAKTVTLTFPEGYSAEQIIASLAENSVCSREKLIEAINANDFSSEFKFLSHLTNAEKRYNSLEGYLFPDTYEFYIGEDPVSVIKKFLNNFNKKWNESYTEKADKLNLNVDDVIRLASIIEKEAAGVDMPVVASIVLNRMRAGMQLECDSTGNYVLSSTFGLSESEIASYNSLYNTYVCASLPIGAICNPGTEAIEAVLNAPETSNYYFIHDKNNKLRVAKTLAEHERNIQNYGLATVE